MRDRRTTLEQPLMCLNQITLQKALTLFKYVTLDTAHKLKNKKHHHMVQSSKMGFRTL